MNKNMNQHIDFQQIARAALGQSLILLGRWLPGGKIDGREYKSLNPTRLDSKIGSFAVNLDTGKWGDFASEDTGLDLISLYAYLNGLSQLDAAKELAPQVGINLEQTEQQQYKHIKAAAEPVKQETEKSEWVPILPVPEEAVDPPVAHPVRGRSSMHWDYYDADGKLLGVIHRFVTSDGGKDVLPCVYARHSKSGKRDWRWMAFPEPRPLYGLYELAQNPDKPVLLIEGEKCADAGHGLLKDWINSVTWSGGTNAVDKTDWLPLALAKQTIYAFPDCDAKRQKLSKQEKEAGVDPASKPLLPENEQPGTKAMLRAYALIKQHNPNVDFRMVRIPAPGSMPDGWDIADAIQEGMSVEEIKQMILDAKLVQITLADEKPASKPTRKAETRRKKPTGPPEEEQRTVLDRFALIYSTETVYDIDAALVMSVAAMRLALGKSCVDWWLQHEKRRMIKPDQLVFDPTGKCQLPAINLFRGIEMVPKPGDFGPIMELLYHLCEESAESDQGVLEVVEWVIKWLALPLQQLGTKMRSALVFHGPQGTGKNLFFEIVAAIYGRYAIVVGQEQLEEKHNDWCSSKLFMIGDEVIARASLFDQKNKLKAFITGETIQINPKFLPIRTEKNHVNVVFLSNEDQPLALEESDRRYFVVYTPPSRKDDLYERVSECIEKGGIEAFYHYLLSINLNGFTAFSRPLMTVAKRELIDIGMKPEHRFVYEWIKGFLPVFFSPCTAGQLFRLFQHWAYINGERSPPQNKFTASIKNFIGVLSDKAGSTEPLMRYKVVKLIHSNNGQKCERVWIPKGHGVPDGQTEGEWMTGAIERFESYFHDYKEGKSCVKAV
jgi:hypothetical protein